MSLAGTGGRLAVQPLRPTMVIGLGGLGREVVFRTRRRLYERYRRTTVPTVAFLWMDHNTEVDPTPELPARVARKVALAPEERVSLVLSSPDLEALLHRQDALPGHGDWVPTEILASAGRTTRSRLLGRLSLHFKEDEIRSLLLRTAGKLAGPGVPEAARQLGFPSVAGEPEVILVTSLAGGLGSGAILPLAQLVRATIPGAHIRGILFLSGLFMAHDVNRRELAMANGYAACREICAAQSAPAGAPFDTLHLVDRENLDGNRPIDPLEPLEMVSESLALEFSRSELGGALRRVRYGGRVGCGFAAFGLATMAPGGGRLRSAAAYLLGASLLERWTSGPDRPAADRCGLTDGWPEAALAGAANDLREEFETYDIPPVEERNQPLPSPDDIRPLLFTHIRAELRLPADAPESDVLRRLSERFEAWCAAAPSVPDASPEPWERFMDRLEVYCLDTCHGFDERIATSDPVIEKGACATALARLRSWSEPWTALRSTLPAESMGATLVGSGLADETPMFEGLGDGVLRHHPGTVVRYRETGALPPSAFATLYACRDAYRGYRATGGEMLIHRHTVRDFDALPDPLGE